MKHTLKEFIKHYSKTKYVSIKYGVHLVHIQFDAEGSFRLLKALENEKLYFVAYLEAYDNLVLSTNKEG